MDCTKPQPGQRVRTSGTDASVNAAGAAFTGASSCARCMALIAPGVSAHSTAAAMTACKTAGGTQRSALRMSVTTAPGEKESVKALDMVDCLWIGLLDAHVVGHRSHAAHALC